MMIRIATILDLEKLVEHDIRHMREDGFAGRPAHPFPKDYPFEKDRMMENKRKGWETEMGMPGWSRSFLLMSGGEILGHLNLKNVFFGALHRAELGMGIEEGFRDRGHGKKLMQTALEWARTQEFIEWVDLSVFSHNKPARRLYESFGFTEIYTVKDQVRVYGESIDDVKMTLKLR